MQITLSSTIEPSGFTEVILLIEWKGVQYKATCAIYQNGEKKTTSDFHLFSIDQMNSGLQEIIQGAIDTFNILVSLRTFAKPKEELVSVEDKTDTLVTSEEESTVVVGGGSIDSWGAD